MPGPSPSAQSVESSAVRDCRRAVSKGALKVCLPASSAVKVESAGRMPALSESEMDRDDVPHYLRQRRHLGDPASEECWVVQATCDRAS
jgi:hypothetical protein